MRLVERGVHDIDRDRETWRGYSTAKWDEETERERNVQVQAVLHASNAELPVELEPELLEPVAVTAALVTVPVAEAEAAAADVLPATRTVPAPPPKPTDAETEAETPAADEEEGAAAAEEDAPDPDPDPAALDDPEELDEPELSASVVEESIGSGPGNVYPALLVMEYTADPATESPASVDE